MGWSGAAPGQRGSGLGIIHQFVCGTEDQYRASLAAVHRSDGSLPDGQLFHVAGPSGDGWVSVAIHDSKESWESFRDKVLMPKLREGVPGGFTTPPQEQAFEVYNKQSS